MDSGDSFCAALLEPYDRRVLPELRPFVAAALAAMRTCDPYSLTMLLVCVPRPVDAAGTTRFLRVDTSIEAAAGSEERQREGGRREREGEARAGESVRCVCARGGRQGAERPLRCSVLSLAACASASASLSLRDALQSRAEPSAVPAKSPAGHRGSTRGVTQGGSGEQCSRRVANRSVGAAGAREAQSSKGAKPIWQTNTVFVWETLS